MEHSTLRDLIKTLEHGHKYHISVVLFERCGNAKTRVPEHQRIHTCPACDTAKESTEGYGRCFRCQEVVKRMATVRKKSFGGLCVNGLYEYCRPIIRDKWVVGVILIGNIYTGSPEQLRRLEQSGLLGLRDTMQQDFTPADCVRTADILESYISYLLDIYGERTPKTFDSLVEDIRAYIEENSHQDFSLAALAEQYNYNEKYLGRLFKQRTGFTIREYCNQVRLKNAKRLLKSTKLSVARISALTGYNNVTYFIRVFKEDTLLSPMQYRQKKKTG